MGTVVGGVEHHVLYFFGLEEPAFGGVVAFCAHCVFGVFVVSVFVGSEVSFEAVGADGDEGSV